MGAPHHTGRIPPGVYRDALALCLQARIDVCVCGFNYLPERRGIDATPGPEFHMAHELASAFQQALGIGNLGTTKKADIDVSFERIDIAECSVCDTRSRVAIMQYLLNVVTAGSHDLKPVPCDYSQFTRMFLHPNLDGRVSLDRTVKSQKLAHGKFISMTWLIAETWNIARKKGYS